MTLLLEELVVLRGWHGLFSGDFSWFLIYAGPLTSIFPCFWVASDCIQYLMD